jgi:uncharacterized protein
MLNEKLELPGTPLSEKDFEEGKILYNSDELHAEFAWDTGIAIGSYLAAMKEGIILGAYCQTCRKTVVPPRLVCEWCFRPMEHYVPLSDTGRIMTFSLCYVTWDVQRVKEPLIPAVIEIDGASPKHGIMHLIGEVEPDRAQIGMRVQAVWKPRSDRQGAITDIQYFKPVKEA